jgi:hypothetical protein
MIQPNTIRVNSSDPTYFGQKKHELFLPLEKGATKTVFYENEIKNLLNFYKEEYIYLKEVQLKNDKVIFTFKKFDYPYFKTEVKHLTREQTVSFVTQASYFYGMINNLFDYNWDYPKAKFSNYVRNEKMGFTDINIKYKRFTENKENSILIFNSVTYRNLNDKIFGEINFELEKYCTGILKFFISK